MARELYHAAARLGLQFVDARVRRPGGAQNGMLTVMCGGDAAAFEAAPARGHGVLARLHAGASGRAS